MAKKVVFTDLLTRTQKALASRYDDRILCEQYARWMIQALSKKTETQLIAHPVIAWTDEQRNKLEEWIQRQVVDHEPLQYLLGSVPFADVDILVEPPILIPRPETEEWCIQLIEFLTQLSYKKLDILDLCSGSGCIAIALAYALPKAHIIGADIDDAALSLAQRNMRHNHITNATFVRSDLFQELSPTFKFDLIVSNPPYIPVAEWKTLDASVKDWESKNALVAADEGLAILKRIIQQAPDFIKANAQLKEKKIPQLILEIGYQQGAAVAEYCKQHNYYDVKVHKDLEGKDRVVTGRVS